MVWLGTHHNVVQVSGVGIMKGPELGGGTGRRSKTLASVFSSFR